LSVRGRESLAQRSRAGWAGALPRRAGALPRRAGCRAGRAGALLRRAGGRALRGAGSWFTRLKDLGF